MTERDIKDNSDKTTSNESSSEKTSSSAYNKLKQRGVDIVPTREERLGTTIAYGGSCQSLLRDCNRKCPKHQERSFSQSGPCDEMMPLLNSAMINGNVVIAHSPAGCPSMIDAVYLLNKIGRLSRSQPIEPISFISTNLSENDVVFGGATELGKAIVEADSRHHPNLITVITSCASGIIGDNVEAVVNAVQPEVKASVVPMRCEGFRSGAVATGYDAFLYALLRVIQKPEKKRKNTVLIVDPLTIDRKNEVEIERLLSKVGISVQWFPLFQDFETVKRASEVTGASTLCNLMSNFFLRALDEKYDVPFAEPPMPVGIEYTGWWLRDVAKLFGKQDEIEKVIAEEEARVRPKLDEIRKVVEGKRVYVGFNLARSVGVQSLLLELGMETAVTTGFEYSDDYGQAPLENLAKRSKEFLVQIGNFQQFEWTNLFHREKPDLLVGGQEHSGWALRDGIPVTALLPDTFYIGYEGAVSFAKEITKTLRNPSYANNISKRVKQPYKEIWYSQDPFKYIEEKEIGVETQGSDKQ
ncbi:MAG: nitrogenase component 1 [Methanotrichaceae archaeon]